MSEKNAHVLNKFTFAALTLKVDCISTSYGGVIFASPLLPRIAGIADQRRSPSLMTIDIELTVDHYVQICALRRRPLWVASTLCTRFQLIFGFFPFFVHSPNCPQIQWFRVIRQFSCEHHKSMGFSLSPVRARLSVFGIWKLENGWLFSVHKSKSNSLECQFAALFSIPQCDPLRESANRQQFPNWKLHN